MRVIDQQHTAYHCNRCLGDAKDTVFSSIQNLNYVLNRPEVKRNNKIFWQISIRNIKNKKQTEPQL